MSNRRFLSLARAVVVLGALASLTVSVGAQQPDPAACAELDSALDVRIAKTRATDILVALRPANDGVKVPRRDLVSALHAIASRFQAANVHYDPIEDISLRVGISTRGVSVIPEPFGRRVVAVLGSHALLSALGVTPDALASMSPGAKQALQAAIARARDTVMFPVDTASALGRLSAAIVAAGRDDALAPQRGSVRDSVSLLVTLRPALDSVLVPLDDREVSAKLFGVSELHVGPAHDLFFDGETLVRAVSHPPEPMPSWPFAALDSTGVVVARLVIDQSGRVDSAASAVQFATPGFGDTALQTLRTWQFTPARLDGCAVRAEVGVGVIFRR